MWNAIKVALVATVFVCKVRGFFRPSAWDEIVDDTTEIIKGTESTVVKGFEIMGQLLVKNGAILAMHGIKGFADDVVYVVDKITAQPTDSVTTKAA